jgi:hypothetical protein
MLSAYILMENKSHINLIFFLGGDIQWKQRTVYIPNIWWYNLQMTQFISEFRLMCFIL